MLNSRKDLDEKIHEILLFNEKKLGVTTVNKSISGRFAVSILLGLLDFFSFKKTLFTM
jgi:hypothetical protein